MIPCPFKEQKYSEDNIVIPTVTVILSDREKELVVHYGTELDDEVKWLPIV